MKRAALKKRAFVALSILLSTIVVVGLGALLTHNGVILGGWSERRAREHARVEARTSARRVLVLGDSFLQVWPIERFLLGELKRYFSERSIGLENTAVGGFGPVEYLERIRVIGPQLRPDLVLLFFYVGNDTSDVSARPSKEARVPGKGGTVVESEATFDWAAMRAHGIDAELIRLAQLRLEHPNTVGRGYVNPHLLRVAQLAPYLHLDNILVERPAAREGWEQTRDRLVEIFEVARGLGAKVCLVAIPSGLQVSRSHLSFMRRATFKVDDRLLSSTRPQTLLAELAREQSVEFVDLLPGFKAQPEDAELYWENDDHFNEAGHILAFRILRESFLDAWSDRPGSP